MMEKYENQMMRLNMYQQQLGQGKTVDYVKLANPEAVSSYLSSL